MMINSESYTSVTCVRRNAFIIHVRQVEFNCNRIGLPHIFTGVLSQWKKSRGIRKRFGIQTSWNNFKVISRTGAENSKQKVELFVTLPLTFAYSLINKTLCDLVNRWIGLAAHKVRFYK